VTIYFLLFVGELLTVDSERYERTNESTLEREHLRGLDCVLVVGRGEVGSFIGDFEGKVSFF
jgi:hypothetical protein